MIILSRLKTEIGVSFDLKVMEEFDLGDISSFVLENSEIRKREQVTKIKNGDGSMAFVIKKNSDDWFDAYCYCESLGGVKAESILRGILII